MYFIHCTYYSVKNKIVYTVHSSKCLVQDIFLLLSPWLKRGFWLKFRSNKRVWCCQTPQTLFKMRPALRAMLWGCSDLWVFYSPVLCSFLFNKLGFSQRRCLFFVLALIVCWSLIAQPVVTSCCCSAHKSVIHLNGPGMYRGICSTEVEVNRY